MRLASAIALVFATSLVSADLSWSPTIRTALVLANKSKQPVYIRVFSPSGGLPSLPQAPSPLVEKTLSQCRLARAASYDDLHTAVPSLPSAGGPGVVVLDSRGHLLKRYGGIVHDLDVLYVVSRAQWRLKNEAKIRAAAAKNPTNPNLNGELAALAAMEGDLGKAKILFRANAAKMEVPRRWAALEAIGDEWRARAEFLEAIHAYRGALSNPMGAEDAGRIRLHLTLCLLRNGDPKGAITEVSKVGGQKPSNTLLGDYAYLVRQRIIANTTGGRAASRPASASRQ